MLPKAIICSYTDLNHLLEYMIRLFNTMVLIFLLPSGPQYTQRSSLPNLEMLWRWNLSMYSRISGSLGKC